LLGKSGRLLPATNSPRRSLIPSRNATIEILLLWFGHQITDVREPGSSVSHRPSACWRAFSSGPESLELANRIISVGASIGFNRVYTKSRRRVRRTTSSRVFMISFGPLPFHLGVSARTPTRSFRHVLRVLISSAVSSVCGAWYEPRGRPIKPGNRSGRGWPRGISDGEVKQ